MTVLLTKELENCYDDGDLDISSLGLTRVPAYKDLLCLPPINTIDLSSNKISSLSNDFCLLVKLTKIDLSKNLLTVLPENFGALVNLRKLDLFDNKITDLPLSFGRLQNLRWLDISGNPLIDELQAAVGKEQGNKHYEASALNIVAYMQKRRENKLIENKNAKNANKKKNKEALKEVNNLINDNINAKDKNNKSDKQQSKKKALSKEEKNNVSNDDLSKKGKHQSSGNKEEASNKSGCGFICRTISKIIKIFVLLGLVYSVLLGYNCHQYSQSPKNVFLPRSELFCKDVIKSIETKTVVPTLGTNLNKALQGSYNKFVLPKVKIVNKGLDDIGVKDNLIAATNFVHTKTVSAALLAQRFVNDGTLTLQKWYKKEGFKYVEAFKKAALETLRFIIDTIFAIAEWLVEFFTPIFEQIADHITLLVNDREKFFNRLSGYWDSAKKSVATRT
uniref:Leucine-rich repeat domain-containing protein n=1 Tax=Parastrongyloides trichosuri TaxID=131310 RepID=A0A0N5A2M3_PARTI